MSYAVFHTEKGKVSGVLIGRHIDRAEGFESTYQHADPSRKSLNIHLDLGEYTQMELNQAIEKRIKEGYQSFNKAGNLKAIRKDAIKYTTHILTGSHERMKEIEENPEKREAWIEANFAFIKQEFGEKNIVRFAVHRDEKTMHIHAVTVSLTEDGRLCAKEIIGDKKQMQLRQDRYAEQMKDFGLYRGERRTGIRHEDAREYYGRMKRALGAGNREELVDVKKEILGIGVGIDKDKTIDKLREELLAHKTALKAKELELLKAKEIQRRDLEFKAQMSERNRGMDYEYKYSLLNDRVRSEMKEKKIKEAGDKYGDYVKKEFNFIPSSFGDKSDEDIKEMVFSGVKKVAEVRNINQVDYALLMGSKVIMELYENLRLKRDKQKGLKLKYPRKGRGME